MTILDDIYNALNAPKAANAYGLTILGNLITNFIDAVNDCKSATTVSQGDAGLADMDSCAGSIIAIANVNKGRVQNNENVTLNGISPTLQMLDGYTGSTFKTEELGTTSDKVSTYTGEIVDEAEDNRTQLTYALNGNLYMNGSTVMVNPTVGNDMSLVQYMAISGQSSRQVQGANDAMTQGKYLMMCAARACK